MADTVEVKKPVELTTLEVLKKQESSLKKIPPNSSDAIKLLRIARSEALKDAKGIATPFINDLEECEKKCQDSIENAKGVLEYFSDQIKKENDKAKEKPKEKVDESKIKWNLVLIQWVIIFMILIVIWRKFVG